MTDIKDTITKLLALATSPYEHEAHAALLKARALMAKHKLREDDIRLAEKLKVVKRVTDITCTKMTDAWAARLSAIIAENYCCKSYRSRKKGSKTVQIAFVGLEDDFDVCEKIFRYAYDCVIAQCKTIQKQNASRHSGAVIRQMKNAYGDGFCAGLAKAYKEQNAEHQEYALLLITPQPVIDAMSHMGRPSPYAKVNLDGWRRKYAEKGFIDGKKFDPTTKLTGGTEDGQSTRVSEK